MTVLGSNQQKNRTEVNKRAKVQRRMKNDDESPFGIMDIPGQCPQLDHDNRRDIDHISCQELEKEEKSNYRDLFFPGIIINSTKFCDLPLGKANDDIGNPKDDIGSAKDGKFNRAAKLIKSSSNNFLASKFTFISFPLYFVCRPTPTSASPYNCFD